MERLQDLAGLHVPESASGVARASQNLVVGPREEATRHVARVCSNLKNSLTSYKYQNQTLKRLLSGIYVYVMEFRSCLPFSFLLLRPRP